MGITTEYLRETLQGIVAQKAQALAVYHQAVGAEQTLLHLIEQMDKDVAETSGLDEVKEMFGADSAEFVRVEDVGNG